MNEWLQFSIQPCREYYCVYYGKRLISTADTIREAEEDIAEYKRQINEYIDTGVMHDWRTAVFFS